MWSLHPMVFISQESKPLMYLRSRSRLTKQKVCCTNYFENSNVPFRENGARKKKKEKKVQHRFGKESNDGSKNAYRHAYHNMSSVSL